MVPAVETALKEPSGKVTLMGVDNVVVVENTLKSKFTIRLEILLILCH